MAAFTLRLSEDFESTTYNTPSLTLHNGMASLATATGGQSIIIYPNSWRAWFKNLANLFDPNTSLGFGTLWPAVMTDKG